jgi:hypothetical protein
LKGNHYTKINHLNDEEVKKNGLRVKLVEQDMANKRVIAGEEEIKDMFDKIKDYDELF